MQYGWQYGQKALHEGESTLSKFINVQELRHYFRVNNSYVRDKLAMIMFPFGRNYHRKRCDFGDDNGSKTGEYYPPVDDLCAPDLYIPLMSIITYMVLAAFARGMAKLAVPPELLAGALTSVLCWMLVEVLAVKLAKYIVGLAHPVATLDFFALSGYKFPGICLVVLLKTLLPFDPIVFTLLAFLLGGFTAFFNYMAYHDLFSREGTFHKRALPICYGVAAFQIPMYLWFCSWPF